MMFRGFIAADVPAAPSLVGLAAELRGSAQSLKVVSTDQLHLTLKFLGETEEGLVPEILTTIREASEGVQPFDIRVRDTGAFPSLARINVVWVGIEGAEPLARIATVLEAALEPLGFPPEKRAWKAHVTLARSKGLRGTDRVRAVLEAHATETFGTHRIDAIHLKKSVLTPQGAHYSIVDSVRLGESEKGR